MHVGHDGEFCQYPHAIRFVNVANGMDPSSGRVFFDLYVVNTTKYEVADSTRNLLANGIAQIGFKANTRTSLRVYVRPSCATAQPCSMCEDPILYGSEAERAACYAAGCGCYAATCYDKVCCSGYAKVLKKQQYGCAWENVPGGFPEGSSATMSVFGLDSGASGHYTEQMTITSGFTYYKTPFARPPATASLLL